MKKQFLLCAAFLFLCGQFLSAQTNHWPLQTDLTDAVGDKDGTNNGVEFENDPVRGQVAYFNGDSYANLPSFVTGLTEISVSCWFRVDEKRVWSRIYSFGRGDQSEPKDVMMVIPVSGQDSMYRFTLKPLGDQWYDVDFPRDMVDIQLDTWYFSGIVLKPDSIIVYHNDQRVFAESGYPNAFGTIEDIENALGKSFWPDPHFKGALSDLRVYNTALSETEMVTLYNETLAIPSGIDNPAGKDVPVIYSYLDKIAVRINKPVKDEIVSVYNITGALMTKKPVQELGQVSFKTGIYIVKVEGSQTNHTEKVYVK